MKTLPRVVTASAIFLSLASGVQAQVPSASPELVAVNSLPLVFVQNLNVQVGEGGLLSGSFGFINQGTTHVGGITYSLQLLSSPPVPPPGEIVPDNYVVFDRKDDPTPISLGPTQTHTVQFSWQTIAVPAGEYRLRVQASLPGDREVGWADVPVNLPPTDTNPAFIELAAVSVEAESRDPITDEVRRSWQALEGPNVSAGSNLVLHGRANATRPKPMNAQIKYEVRQLLQGGEPAQIFSGESVTITTPDQAIAQNVTTASRPGAYAVSLYLTDESGTRQSSIAEFRYVVVGPSVSIVSHTLAKSAFRKGETAQVKFTIAGPADRDSEFVGSVEVILLAGERVLAFTETAVQVGDAASSNGTANLVLQDALCQAPTLRVVLRDQVGNEVDRAESTLNSLTIPKCPILSRGKIAAILTGLVVVAGVLVALILWLIKRPRAAAPTLLTVLAFGAALAYSGKSEASGIILREGRWSAYINLWVNQPLSGSVVAGPTVPYSARLSWQVCSNSGYQASLAVSALKNGGQATRPYQFPSDAWQQLATTSAYLRGTGISKDAAIYWSSKDLVANLEIPQPPSSTMTTLWTLGQASSNVDLGKIHDLTWLNLPTPPPTPTPDPSATPTPTPLGSPTITPPSGPAICSDGLDNDNDGHIDATDPGCHPSDRNASNAASYQPADNDERDSDSNATPTPTPTPSFDPGGVIEID